MASSERSLGWTTGVAGTDGASAYDQTRFIAMQKILEGSNGVLTYNNHMVMSGLSLGVLTIADGAAIVGGFFYETNGLVTMSVSGLATGTYNVVVFANTNASAQTVAANGAGTTTVASGTTRVAMATTAQTTTITTNVGSGNIFILGTVSVSVGIISNIVQSVTPARGTFAQTNTWAQMTYGGTAMSVPNNTVTTLQGSSVYYATNSADGLLTCDTVTGIITCRNCKLLQFDIYIVWDTNTTGYRSVFLGGNFQTGQGLESQILPTVASGSTLYYQRHTGTVDVTNTFLAQFYVTVYQNSGATRTVNANMFRLVRLA